MSKLAESQISILPNYYLNRYEQQDAWAVIFDTILKHDGKNIIYRGSHSQVFLRKGALKICSKFPGEDPCQSVTLV